MAGIKREILHLFIPGKDSTQGVDDNVSFIAEDFEIIDFDDLALDDGRQFREVYYEALLKLN